MRLIIDGETWFYHIKSLGKFVAEIGYKGLLILVDEAVNLYQISTTVTHEKNYNGLLAIFNDTKQCKAEHLGICIGGTTKFLEDPTQIVDCFQTELGADAPKKADLLPKPMYKNT